MLYLLCGKIASGKSTLAARLAEQHGALSIAEDAWLEAIFERFSRHFVAPPPDEGFELVVHDLP